MNNKEREQNTSLPTFPILITFDIENGESTKEVWSCRMARILALLWRPKHLANQHYWTETLEIGREIERKRPQNVEDLIACFFMGRRFGVGSNYQAGDIREFAYEAIDYFTGKKEVEYRIEKGRQG